MYNKVNYNKSITEKENKILAYYTRTIPQDKSLTKLNTQIQIQKTKQRRLKRTQKQQQLYNNNNNNNLDKADTIDDIEIQAISSIHSTLDTSISKQNTKLTKKAIPEQQKKYVIMD